MREQYTTPETPYPAEGRCDIAADLEEEQGSAFSTHHAATAAPGKKTPAKPQQQEKFDREGCHPAEGRCDVAKDLEEEQGNAYSSHHTGHAS